MGGMSSEAARALSGTVEVSRGVALVDVDALVWVLLIPCALLSVAALLALGPPLGRLAFPDPGRFSFWDPAGLKPEPTEQARYMILSVAPLLLAGATIASARRAGLGAWLTSHAARGIVALAQVLTIAFIVLCWRGQYRPSPGIIYFTPATLLSAGGLAAVLVITLKGTGLRERCAGLLRESRARSIAAFALALALTFIWLLHAVNGDGSIGAANSITKYHIAFPFDEAFAVVNGLTPLVDFSAQYGSLWPFVSALSLSLFGKTLLVFSVTMCVITGLALLAIFDVLRRATGSSLSALLLYLPLLATSCFLVIGGDLITRHTFASYYPMFPLRYAGPYFLAWLTARRLQRDSSAGTWPLFLAAGLVVLNNTEFGIAGLSATVAALLWTMREHSRRAILLLGANLVAGLVGALVVVSTLTLLRAGSLPHLERLTEFARVYLLGGFGLIPMPRILGFHLIIYITYVAAIAVGTAQRLRNDANRVLTGMLVWSGVFGLGSATYYVGRSSDDTLPSTFSAWALAVALLTVVAVMRTAGKQRRLPSLAQLAVFYGMGIAACSLAQTPMPWTQLDRIRQPADRYIWGTLMPDMEPGARAFVSGLADGRNRFVVRRGAPVAILSTMGHRIADAYGIRNVVPYTGLDSIQTREQLEDVLEILRRAGGNTVLMPIGARQAEVLSRHGFAFLSMSGDLRRWEGDDGELQQLGMLSKWVDTRHLHPRALR